jgi:hypothetical protein
MENQDIKVTLPIELDKAQEILAINCFYTALPADSFLKRIFKGLPEYCEEHVKNDWGYSPLETMQALNEDLMLAGTKLAKNIAIIKKQGVELDDKDNEIANLQFSLLKKDDEITAALSSHDFIYGSLDKQILLAGARELEILELKARLYDYMIKEGGNK